MTCGKFVQQALKESLLLLQRHCENASCASEKPHTKRARRVSMYVDVDHLVRELFRVLLVFRHT